MKLKNSYVLLMVMAIFLLISIGSVCASDINATDDVSLADDGSDVVLANESTAATEKIDTKIVSENVKVKNSEAQKINVTVNDKESKAISISKENITVAEGTKKLNFTYANNSITLSNKLGAGNHSLLITYLGNAQYKNSTKNILLSVIGPDHIDSASTVNVNQSNTVEIPIKITDYVNEKPVDGNNFTVAVSYKDGNDTKSINISNLKYENGKLIFNPELVDNITSYNMIVTYKDNKTSLPKNIKLNKVRGVNITLISSPEVYYQDGNFTFKVVDAYTGEVIANEKVTISGTYNKTAVYWDMKQSGGSISISTSKTLTTDANGIATLNNVNFYPGLLLTNTAIYAPAGEYEVTVSGASGLSGQYKGTIKIKKVTSVVKVENYNEYYGTNKNVKVIVTAKETGKPLEGVAVFFNITDSDGKEITFTTKGANNTTVKVNRIATNENGSFELPINNLLPGKYSVYASLNDSANYNKSESKKTATIKEIPVKYTISTTGIITVTNKLTGKKVSGALVLIEFDGSKNKRFIGQTNTNGKIQIVTVGKHKIAVSDADPRYTATAVKKTITNKKIAAKASAPKVTTYYKTAKYFTVKLTNSAKKPIYDAKLNIKVYVTSKKYYSYKGNTGIDGQIRLSTSTLKPGTYKVVVTSGATKNFSLKKVTSKIVIKKAPTKLYPKKLTAKKGVKKYFKVTVKNTKTKKVIKGVKVKIKVYTGKKYKTYTVKTNSKGIANLNVKSLKVGTHKVVVSSANKYCVAKTAKSTIKITKK